MKQNQTQRSSATWLGIFVLLLLCRLNSLADILNWYGTSATSGNWSDSINWTNSLQANAAPTSGDCLVFTAANQPYNTNNLSAFSAGWMEFDNGNFTLWGNVLTLASGITNNTGDNILALPTVFSTAETLLVNAGSITFQNVITNNGDLTIDGPGTVTWGYVPNTSPLQGLMGPSNLVVNGTVTVSGGFVYPVNGNNFTGNTIVNGVLNMGAGCFDNNSLIGQSLTINPNGTVHTTAPHIAGAAGRPLSIYGGTLDMSSEAYFTTVTLSNATLMTSTTKDLRGSGSFTNLASTATTSFGVSLNLTSSRTIGVALGSADPAIDFTGNGNASIQGGGTLTKVGQGKMRISAPATYTGPTLINEGTLALASTMLNTPTITVASNAVFDISATSFSLNTNQSLTGVGSVLGTLNDSDPGADGSTLSPGGDTGVGTLYMAGLSLSGNGLALNFNLSSVTTVGGTANDLLVVTNLTLASGATNTVNFVFNGAPAAGAYTLIQYPLGQGPAAGPVTTLAAAASRSTYSFTSDGTSIKVTVSAHPAPLVWRGDGATNLWDLATTTNWINGAAKDVFLTGDNATFNDTGSNTPPVNLVGGLSANVVTVTGTKDWTFSGSGKVSGGASLIKNGSGTLTVLTPNDNASGGLISSGVVNVGAGTSAGNLGTGNLTNNTKVNFFENASVTYGGNMSGSGSLSAFMPGATLTVTGTNTYTGGTIISNGTFQIGNATAGSSVAGTITNWGTLNLYRSDAFTNQNTITSAGNTLEYANGDVNVRGVGGMTVDGTAPINVLGSFSVGQSAYGKVTVNPGGVVSAGGFVLLGNPGSVNGEMIQNGGTVNSTNTMRIGHWATEVSYYTMNGGTLNVPFANLAVGWDGIGLFTMTNGTVNVRGMNVDDNTATAALNGTNSTFTMTGGQLNVGVNGIGGNTATIKLGGGTIAAAAPAGFSSGMAMILTNGVPTFDSSNSVITLSGVLSGTNGLVKQGTGYLNLNGVNTFTGAVTVANGTLEGSGTIVAPVTVQSGAKLSAGGPLATGTLTVSNVTMNSGAGMTFDLNSGAATGDQLVARGTLALDSVGTPATINFLGGTPFTGGPYTLITNLVPRTGHLVFNTATRYAATVDETNPNRINISFTGSNGNLVWRNNANSLWNVNTDNNWLNNGVPDKYLQSDNVIFDDSGIASSNVTLSATMTPASVTVNAAGTYSLSGGDLAGLGSLTKSGSGTLIVSNNLNQLGGTTVSAGTLKIGNGGTTGSVGGNITDYGTVVFNHSDTITYGVNPVNATASVISGPGSLVQAGSGKLMIVATMNHFGGTTINPGSTLQLGNGPIVDSGSLGSSTATNNGTVNFYRLSNVSVATPYTGAGTFNFLGTGNSGQSGYVLNATNTFTGPVTLSLARIQSGAGALSFGSPSSISVGPGSQVYAVAQPYSSVYNIPLTLNGTGWQDGLGALRIENGGTWAGNITLVANSRIGVNNATSNNITGTISGNYELETYGGNNTAVLNLAPSSANSYNALRVSIGTAGAITLAGNNNAIPNGIPLTMNGGTLKLNGFSKSFAPFFNLSGSSSIQNGSTTSPMTVGLTPAAGATVNWNGTFNDGGPQPLNVVVNATTPPWTMTMATGSGGWTGNLTNNGGTMTCNIQNTGFGAQGPFGRYVVGNNGAVFITTINNVFAGYNGSLILSNSTWICNRYVSFNPQAGILYLANSTVTGTNSTDPSYYNISLPSTVVVRGSSPSYMLGGGTTMAYDMQANGTTYDVADVTGNSASDLIIGGGTSTAFVRNPANSSTPAPLIKTGAGTLELGGANAYTGPTTISAGTLKLGSAATLSTPSVSIASGAFFDVSQVSGGFNLPAGFSLSGNGAVIGNVTDSGGAVISPGASAGTLVFSNALTLNALGTLNFDLANATTVGGGVNDLIVVGGDLTLPGTPETINFNFLNGAPVLGSAYTLMKYSGNLNGTISTAFTNQSRYVVTFTADTVNKLIKVTFTGGAASLYWTGTDPLAPATWDVNTSTNWNDGSANNVYFQNDTVVFDDRGGLNTSVNLTTLVNPQAVTVNSTNNYTINGSGTIEGATGINKANTNTLTLSTSNSFKGPINITGGTLISGHNNALPGGAVVNVSSNASFDYAGFGPGAPFAYSFNIAGSGPDGNGAIINSGGAIYQNASISNLTLTGDAVIGGSGRWDLGSSQAGSKVNGNGHNLTKLGTAGMSLRSQTLTNIASITVSNGSAWYESFSQTNSWTANMTNYVAPGAVLGIYGAQAVNVPVVLSSATILNQGGGNPATWTGGIVISNDSVFNNSAIQSFYGSISGPGAMWVNGGISPLLLSNANSYAGGTIISNAPANPAALSASAGFAAIIAGNPSALGAGPLTINGSSYPSLTTNTAFFGTNTLQAVEFAFSGPGTVPNAIVLPSLASVTVSNVSLHGRDSGQIINLTGVISGGFNGLTNIVDFGDAINNGVMRYANINNSFQGTISVYRGLLAVTSDGALGNSGNVLRLNNPAGLRFDGPAVNVSHAISATAATSFNVFGDNNGDGTPETVNAATISGVISGSGGLNVLGGATVSGTSSGSLTLSGNNTFTGGLSISPDTRLIAANVNALGTTAGATTVNPGATLSLNAGGTYASEPLTLSGFGVKSGGVGIGALENLSGANVLNGNITLGIASSIGMTSGSLALGGVISGANPLTVTGPGSLTVSGANTYSAGTIVNGATLFLNGSLPAGNAVSVSGGGTLAGVGTINGPVTIASGANLVPGVNGVGRLTVNGPLALAGTTTMELNKAGSTNDSVVGITTVTYGGTLNVSNLGGTLAGGDKFTLFSSLDRIGTFTSVNLPALGSGLSWTNMLSIDGSIMVLGGVNTSRTNITYSVSGNSMTLSWPSDHTGWRLLAQTNHLNTGVSGNPVDWGTVPGSSTTNSVTVPLDGSKPSEFYKLVYP